MSFKKSTTLVCDKCGWYVRFATSLVDIARKEAQRILGWTYVRDAANSGSPRQDFCAACRREKGLK